MAYRGMTTFVQRHIDAARPASADVPPDDVAVLGAQACSAPSPRTPGVTLSGDCTVDGGEKHALGIRFFDHVEGAGAQRAHASDGSIWPLIRMTGMSQPFARTARASARPSMPGMRMSTSAPARSVRRRESRAALS
jgi:hypothetical protein